MPERGPLIAQVIIVRRRVDFSDFPRLVKAAETGFSFPRASVLQNRSIQALNKLNFNSKFKWETRIDKRSKLL